MLAIKPNGTYIDCTAGLGGHSTSILNKLDQKGLLICVDWDNTAINYLQKHFQNDQRVKIVKANFSDLSLILTELNVKQVDGILLDLGVSSIMFDDPTRGFSYHQNSKLDMRMDTNQPLDAFAVVNNYNIDKLKYIFQTYGDIARPMTVVNAIIAQRNKAPINTTAELLEIIKTNIPQKMLFKKKHPARTYFQAIRIEVNNEITNLRKVLSIAPQVLASKGRLVIITFHSIEDRMVKQTFNKLTSSSLPNEVPIKDEKIAFALLTKKATLPSLTEINHNRRARSAKLRAIQRN